MKINLRQEIAMWVLGLPWAVLSFFGILTNSDGDLQNVVAAIAVSLVSLVPVCLVIFTLRDRKKAD